MNEIKEIHRNGGSDTRSALSPEEIAKLLETQNPEQDRIPRERRGHYFRIPETFAYSTPSAGRNKAEGTPFADVINVLKNHFPVRSLKLSHDYDDKLHPTYQNLIDTYQTAREELAFIRKVSLERDKEIDEKQKELAQQTQKLLEPLEQKIEDTEAALDQAYEQASITYAKAGAFFHPDQADEQAILQVKRPDIETAATDIEMPFDPPGTVSLIAKFFINAISVLVGVLVGISIGIVAGIIRPEDFTNSQRLLANVTPVIMFSLIGIAIAFVMRYGVLQAFRVAAQATYAQFSISHRIKKYILAFITLTGFIVVDTIVERHGILKIASARQQIAELSGKAIESSPGYIFYILGLLITAGYFIYSAYEGYLFGRSIAVKQLCNAHSEKSFLRDLSARRETPAVQDALKSLNTVTLLKNKQKELQEKRSAIENDYKSNIEKLESQRIPYPLDFTHDQKLRIQDALDNYHGAQHEIDKDIEDLLKKYDTITGISTTGGYGIGLFRRFINFLKRLFGITNKPTNVATQKQVKQ